MKSTVSSDNDQNNRLTETLAAIGERIHELRIEKGYKSHEQFAQDFDLPRIQYWRIEKGKSNLTMRSLFKILSIHNLTFEDFFTRVKKGKTKK